MKRLNSRRRFLVDVGRGTLLATVGPAFAADLGLASQSLVGDDGTRLKFGSLEPLVAELQELPPERLQAALVQKLKSGVELQTLIGAAALANARAFGGEDYVGFHTFMALAPALKMASLMPAGSEPLPVFKVLYRNSSRLHESGHHAACTLDAVAAGAGDAAAGLHHAIRARDVAQSERLLADLVRNNPQEALDRLLPAVQDNPEVHRTVLPFRAWDMQRIVGTEHALTLLRQSLRYCLKAEPSRRAEWDEHGRMLTTMLDEFQLAGREPGFRAADDSVVTELSRVFSTDSPADAARAAASILADGFDPAVVGEALALSASRLVLRDRGRPPQWEDRGKPAGSVHGDSIGVHASDAVNAWRHLAGVSGGTNRFACLIIGAWQVARDRGQSSELLAEPLPVRHHLDRVAGAAPGELVTRLHEAVRNNLQGQACAIVQQCGTAGVPADTVFSTLLQYAVSEDGALHAEKYFHTVYDDFHATRESLRWSHLVALARVTASEYGRPAAGQQEARDLLGVNE